MILEVVMGMVDMEVDKVSDMEVAKGHGDGLKLLSLV